MGDIVWAAVISVIISIGAFLSDRIFDRVKVSVLSRKAIHMTAGIGMLIAPFVFHSFWWPLGVAIFFLVALSVLNFTRAAFGYGIRTPGRLVEIWFCLSCVVVYATLWQLSPWLATAPLLLLSWGDGFTGLLRWRFYRTQGAKGWAGTIGMFVTGLLIALMIHPYWLGAVGATVGTIAEKLTPSQGKWLDDNWTIVASSALIMFLIGRAIGAY